MLSDRTTPRTVRRESNMALGHARGGRESRKRQRGQRLWWCALLRQPADADTRERETDARLRRDDRERDRYRKSARDQRERIDRCHRMCCREDRETREPERRMRP